MELGQYNKLKIARKVDFGVYLDGGDGTEVLLPARYLTGKERIGDEVEVFVYNDSEDRPVATTEKPFGTVGEMVYLTVKQVNDIGAFLEWGLQKDLLVPYSEQRQKMRKGGTYLIYIYIDDATKRIVATAKVEKYIGNVFPEYRRGDKVDCIFYKSTEIGYRVIVDNAHYGMLYADEMHCEIDDTQHFTAYVKGVREDGKIDLTLSDKAERRTAVLADKIVSYLKLNRGMMTITDKSEPELISSVFACSKKDFKKAVGLLYKNRQIEISEGKIELVDKK